MAQVTFPFSDLSELVSVSTEEAIETLTMLGFPAEKTEVAGELTVEVTPNRPDALCVEGLARILRCYRTGEPSAFKVNSAKIEAFIDPSTEKVRPIFGTAAIRNVEMTDALLRSIMQVQEKLHETLGRKRRKVAIGLHDLDKITPPFRYFACKRNEASFIPLDMQGKMTPQSILEKHPKGKEYAHLVGELCPMIEDKKKNILSFPPIINGELTRITESTKNIFLDVTGTSKEAVKSTVNIIVSMFAERNADIEEVNINGKPYPLLKEEKWPVPVKEAERILGIELTEGQAKEFLLKMGYRVEGKNAFVPGYRADVMNEIDIIEDIAIAYGFNNFEPRLPDFASTGKIEGESKCHDILVGLGYSEAVTWNLSNPSMAEKALHLKEKAVEIENPLTEDFTIFRQALLPNMLSVLFESRNESLPIRLYEIGSVAMPGLKKSLCMASMHPKASFSEVKGAVEALFETAGKSVEFRKGENGAFIKGRCAEIWLEGNKIGHMGEISPEALANFNLEQPVCAAEMELSP